MEFKPCPVCGRKPLLFSEDEVMCINGECSVYGVVTEKRVWNIRAEVVARDHQILKELKLEHELRNNVEKYRMKYT